MKREARLLSYQGYQILPETTVLLDQSESGKPSENQDFAALDAW